MLRNNSLFPLAHTSHTAKPSRIVHFFLVLTDKPEICVSKQRSENNMKLLYSTICIVFLAMSAMSAEETPKDGVARLEATWTKGNGSFTWDYWLVSGSIAEKHGLALIPIVMERSKTWKGEEGLIYVPMLALLPRDESTKALKIYQEGKDERLAMWAGEFLTEFDMSDTKEAVEKYKKEKAK